MYKFLLIFLFSFSAMADTDWTRVAMNTATVLDWAQTRAIARDGTHYETNPIIGKYPSDADVNRYFIAALLTYNLVGEYLIDEKYQAYFYGGVLVVHGQATMHNYNAGVRFRFD